MGYVLLLFFLQLLQSVKIAYIWGEKMVGGAKTRGKIILLTIG